MGYASIMLFKQGERFIALEEKMKKGDRLPTFSLSMILQNVAIKWKFDDLQEVRM